ncbi:anti-sigma-D factor RsdA [Amycolatopsis sp. NPDC049691]|uniref:anti-sigma-D factor RsdA n=1 Tax=Amycolatopsis sp. NPDC049691 TaxID=3155155 RepID=UPI00342DFE4B
MTGHEKGYEPDDVFGSGLSSSEAEFAADLSAVQADDALLDALGGSDPALADGLGDQELNALLVAWRRDIDSEPLAELVDVDTAVRTVTTANLAKQHASSGRRRRLLVPVAVAAAVLAIAFTGTGLAARSAQPGDTLWGLAKVLYSDHTRSVEAAANAKLDLEKANLAIAGGNLDAARQALDAAQAALSQVSDEDNRDQLMEQHRQLAAQLQNPDAPVQGPTQTTPTQVPPGATSVQVPPAGSATSIPGSGSGTTSLPGTATPTPTPPPPTTTPQPPTTEVPPTTTAASGNDPGTNTGRSESSVGGQSVGEGQ